MNRTSERDDGSGGEVTQRSVAELLARYGEPAPANGRRHRRRAPESDTTQGGFAPADRGVEDTAPQAIIGRVRDGAAPNGSAPNGSGAYGAGTLPRQTGSGHRRADDAPAPQPPPPPVSPPPTAPRPAGPPVTGQTGRRRRPEPEPAAGAATQFDLPVVGDDDPFGGPAESEGPQTAQIPRVEPAPPPPARPRPTITRLRGGEPPAGLGPQTTSMPAPPPETAAGGLFTAREAAAEPHDVRSEPHTDTTLAPYPGDADDYAAQAYDDEYDHYEPGDHTTDDRVEDAGELEQPERHVSPMREWAVVAGQVGLGIVGGAALWLLCEWLWQSIPVLALVVALLVITGLVWVVRYVRRTEDLQTTVIAVLVGLFVTVSPAALLLVGR